ncbi:YwqG family protein [Entamoeba marina]
MSSEGISEEIINKIVGEIISTTSLPTIELKEDSATPTVFNSKISGKPYLPKDFEYPMSRGDEPHPLLFLAQLNFSEFDKLEDFPTTGILQFYIDGTDDLSGMDMNNFTNSSGFRVIYHQQVINDEILLTDPPEVPKQYSPIEGCTKMVGEKVTMTMTVSDFRMQKLLEKYATKYEVDVDELNDTLIDGNYLSDYGTRIGGYAGFIQWDPRSEKRCPTHTINLFTCNSGMGVSWGDCGVANFLITKEDLLNKNFNNVLFIYDC